MAQGYTVVVLSRKLTQCFRRKGHDLIFVCPLTKDEVNELYDFSLQHSSRQVLSLEQRIDNSARIAADQFPRDRPARVDASVRADTIRLLLHRAQPVILVDDGAEFTSDDMCTQYGHQKCRVESCDDSAYERTTNIAGFFGVEWLSDAAYRVKDWPDDAKFSEACPELTEKFYQDLRGEHFIRPEGFLNMLSMHPNNASKPPDLGLCLLFTKSI